jgi:hypothetical protein
MDLIEMVMEIEDQFGLSIPDEDAQYLVTVGQTYLYVVRALRERGDPEPGVCPSARLFHQLRRQIVREYAVPRRAVRPAARVGDLVPRRDDQLRWNDSIAVTCGLKAKPFRALHPMSPRFPPHEMSVRELIQTRTPRGILRNGEFYCPDGTVDEAVVWETLVGVVANQSGVHETEILWETHFINDLNLD